MPRKKYSASKFALPAITHAFEVNPKDDWGCAQCGKGRALHETPEPVLEPQVPQDALHVVWKPSKNKCPKCSGALERIDLSKSSGIFADQFHCGLCGTWPVRRVLNTRTVSDKDMDKEGL